MRPLTLNERNIARSCAEQLEQALAAPASPAEAALDKIDDRNAGVDSMQPAGSGASEPPKLTLEDVRKSVIASMRTNGGVDVPLLLARLQAILQQPQPPAAVPSEWDSAKWIEEWADKELGKGIRPCGWPAFGSIAYAEVCRMLAAVRAEAKRSRK